jgi:hypothetical protein
MDNKNLELIRGTALEHVQRCMSTCRLSTSCRYRHRHTPRGTPRNGGPCNLKVRRLRRFVFEVTQGEKDGTMPERDVRRATAASIYALDLMQAAKDAAPTELLFGGPTKRPTADEGFFGEAKKAHRPGSAATRTAAAPQSRATHSMTLTQRKNKLIDTCRAVRSAATEAAPPETVSQTESTQKPGKPGTDTSGAMRRRRRSADVSVPAFRGFVLNGIHSSANVSAPTSFPRSPVGTHTGECYGMT